MNVYGQLWGLLCPEREGEAPGVLGTLTGISPLAVTVKETILREGLLQLGEQYFTARDLGATVALLPCGGGWILLGKVVGE